MRSVVDLVNNKATRTESYSIRQCLVGKGSAGSEEATAVETWKSVLLRCGVQSHEVDPYDVVLPQFPLSTASQMIGGRVQRPGGLMVIGEDGPTAGTVAISKGLGAAGRDPSTGLRKYLAQIAIAMIAACEVQLRQFTVRLRSLVSKVGSLRARERLA
ncbi:hypothetical protein PG993_011393 [Apiospora rasikravindrae]|uniref:Uncharacterized protein n=1 Tax=Apiospora rasikravindrae TaxID=990691 RepID=A0ABR1SGG0_9PEZI